MPEITANNRIRECVEKSGRQNNGNEDWNISMASYRYYLANIRN
jgi:hypothetical protein